MPRATPVRTLAILFAVNVVNIYDRQVLGPLAEPLRKEFGLSDTQIGALSSLFVVVYAIAGMPLGRWSDRASRKRILAAGVAVWASLTGLGGLAANYAMLLVSRLGVAVGEAVCAPAAASWIGDLFPAEKRARALSTFMLGVPVGLAAGFSLSGPAAQAWGWRAALALAALPAAILVPLLLGLEEPARGATENRLLPAGSARELLRIPAFRWIVVSGAVVNFSLYVLSTFLPAFLSRYHGLSLASAGLWSGLGQGAFGLLGGVAAGQLGDFVMRRRAGGRLYSAAAAAFCAGPAALLAILQPAGSAATAVLLLMAAYGLLNMYYGLVYAAIQDIVAPAARGFAMALYYMAMYLCGAAFGPVLTGSLSDLLARRAAGGAALTEAARATGLHQALYVLPLLCSVLALVLAAGGRSMRAEPRTTERIVLYNKK